MAEKNNAVLNIAKALMDVSLPTLAAIGSATGNPLIAGATAFPLAASGTLKSLLLKSKEERLELAEPRWWSNGPAAWQEVCSQLEDRLPAVFDGVAARLRQEQGTSLPKDTIRRVFEEELTSQLAWDVRAQDRGMTAAYIAPLLLAKSEEVIRKTVEPLRADALAEMVTQVFVLLADAQKTGILPATAVPSTSTISANGATPLARIAPNEQEVAALLQQKMLQDAYDVYICYDEQDQDTIMQIGENLKSYGILPWFDGIDVRPGSLKRSQQAEQIVDVAAALVCIGQHAMARDQLLQMYTCIEQYVDHECAVIPVLLADAPQQPELPTFLKNFGWVNFRKKTPDPLKQLIWGITGVRL